MTTAHRPTFHAAVGGKEQGGGRYIAGVTRTHVHDLPGMLSIKTRAPGSAGDVASKEELRAALEAKEIAHLKAIGKRCHLAQFLKAIVCCTKVLAINGLVDASRVKALFRRGSARIKTADFVEARECCSSYQST